jgi:hypothetical protein
LNTIRGITVTDLLDKAFSEAAKLPAPEQDALAGWILSELASESRWQQALDESHEGLARLADEALAQYRQGQTELLDPDSL